MITYELTKFNCNIGILMSESDGMRTHQRKDTNFEFVYQFIRDISFKIKIPKENELQDKIYHLQIKQTYMGQKRKENIEDICYWTILYQKP